MKTIGKPLSAFLIVLSLAGCAVVWTATSGFGAGLSSDAVRIISTGQNFIEGRGLITSSGTPLIFCPPYYSILLGVLSIVFSSDVFTVGMVLNILVFGAIIFCSGILFSLIKPHEPIYAILGSLIVFSSPSLVRISANVAPDPLFILFVILFLIAAVKYLRHSTRRSWAGLMVVALLAASQRYIGLAIILAGVVVILWQQRKVFWPGLRDAAIFSFVASAPTLAYIIFHNYLGYGTLTGPRLHAQPMDNIRIAFEKLVHWFIPGSITMKTGMWAWVLLALVLFLVGLIIAHKNKQLKGLSESGAFIPALTVIIFYGATLIFMLSYKEHSPLLWDRIHIALLVPLFVLMIEVLPRMIPPLPSTHLHRLVVMLVVVFSLWLIYPLKSTYAYVVDSMENGEASLYNIHNTGAIRKSELAQYLSSYPFPQDARLYSNYNETAWFLTRRQVSGIPTKEQADDWSEIDGNTYLIWFELPELSYMPKTMQSLAEISMQVNLEQVYSGRDGSLYLMSMK